MRTVELSSWRDFEAAVLDVHDRRQKLKSANRRPFDTLFRGLGDSRFRLETTLERAYGVEAAPRVDNFLTYYERVAAMRPSIERRYNEHWDIPTAAVFSERLQNLPPAHFAPSNESVTRYLIYLRHHGCPSPLLDWSASPNVAGFFAFDSMVKDATSVSVYALLHDSTSFSEDDVRLVIVPHEFGSHSRHTVQEACYSICLEAPAPHRFVRHESSLSSPTESRAAGLASELIKFNIAAHERITALRILDGLNINAFSLLGSEDALIRTLARRELSF